MTNHLTDDQIARWVAGQFTAVEEKHADGCRTCATEMDRLRNALALFRTAMGDRADRRAASVQPGLASIIRERALRPFDSVTSVSDPVSLLGSLLRQVRERWEDRTLVQGPAMADAAGPFAGIPLRPFRYASLASLLVHAAIIGALAIPAALMNPPAPPEMSVILLNNTPLILDAPRPAPSRGGGGGGMKAPAPASKGVLPRGADKQLTPPVIEVKNLFPELAVEPTIVAVQLASLPQFNVTTIGDPNGVIGPPSPGPGTGGGIGPGNGTGVGPGNGPGAGPGQGGGQGGEAYAVGGSVSPPRILFQPPPEYSDDARKARAQGTVELLIIVRADGSVEFQQITKRLGYGLDQKAIDAVMKWRFAPGQRDGKPVNTRATVVVNFALR